MDTLKNDATMEETIAYLDECETLAMYKGYCVADLHKVFDGVANPTDWKAPIHCVCAGEAVMPIVAAIQYYTATTPKVTLNMTTMEYYIDAVGYRAGPAGDH